MYQEYARLVVYRGFPADSIFRQLCSIIREFDEGSAPKYELIDRIHAQIKALLDLSTECGFDGNLWHCYLTWLLMTHENSFSLVCEKKPAPQGTVNLFVLQDLQVFRELFDYDFSRLEKRLNLDCFSLITHYHAVAKSERMYNRGVSEMVLQMVDKLENSESAEEMYDALTDFYTRYGAGIFAFNRAFRFEQREGDLTFLPIRNMDNVVLSDLVGYEMQKQLLIDNTRAFVEGRSANNVLLYGDSGTGKSTSIKAIVNEFYQDGLRMVEIYRHQFKDLSALIARLKLRSHRFIIYMDDLSFEDFETDYKFLKAVIEGGVETRPENILIYATSNRRHLIKETLTDREGDDIHESDTRQELMSLSARFGLTITFGSPDRERYLHIVEELAKQYGVELDPRQLAVRSEAFAVRSGGRSARVAKQFIELCKAGVFS